MNHFFIKKDNFLFSQTKQINHGFSFVSTISPFLINNIKLLDDVNDSEADRKSLIKQSYILMSWFYYLSLVDSSQSKKKLKIAVLPKKNKKFTLNKAPIAHKNWSKEQFKFEYFQFKISFKSNFKSHILTDTENQETTIDSINAASFFIFLTKKNFYSFETNTLFLKYFQVFFYYSDSCFFNYNHFLRKSHSLTTI